MPEKRLPSDENNLAASFLGDTPTLAVAPVDLEASFLCSILVKASVHVLNSKTGHSAIRIDLFILLGVLTVC